ncbi:MAG: tRNA pseudouridine(38-40) synthase TruA [Spirochaetota bacterium]
MVPAEGKRIANRRIALLIEYDGQLFNGWQVQNSGLTIQGELERSLRVLTGESTVLTASGRTDAGVHALRQVAHFDTQSSIPLHKMVRSINGISVDAVSVKNAYEVPGTFHARYSALDREYEYRIYNHPQRSPFMVGRALWFPQRFDMERANQAAGLLTGTHDFASFCKKSSHENGTVRTVKQCRFVKNGEYITMIICAESFIHNMVRIIAGTVCEIVRDKRDPETVLEMLKERRRECGGVTAPAYALYLTAVRYDPPLESYKDAYSGIGP